MNTIGEHSMNTTGRGKPSGRISPGRYKRVSVPDSAHPLVKRLFAEMASQQCTLTVMSDRSGVNINTLKNWRTRTAPLVENIEACLNVLGLELTVKERKDS